MNFQILTPMAQGVYRALGSASSVDAIRTLQQGKVSMETFAQLVPLGEALQNHSLPSGKEFLAGLAQTDRARLTAVLQPRSSAQLTRVALSLRRVPEGLRVKFNSPENLLDEIGLAIGHPPYSVGGNLERDIHHLINKLEELVRQTHNPSITPFGLRELKTTFDCEKDGALRLMSSQMEASATLLFGLMREHDLHDITAGTAMDLYVWLVERHPEALEYMESKWPSDSERDDGDVDWINWMGAAILFLKDKNTIGIRDTVQRIAKKHPSDQPMLLDLMRP